MSAALTKGNEVKNKTMTTKTIYIDENNENAKALLNYIATLDFVKIVEKEDTDVPQWQRDIVLNRIKTTNRTDYLSQKQFESQLDLEE